MSLLMLHLDMIYLTTVVDVNLLWNWLYRQCRPVHAAFRAGRRDTLVRSMFVVFYSTTGRRDSAVRSTPLLGLVEGTHSSGPCL